MNKIVRFLKGMNSRFLALYSAMSLVALDLLSPKESRADLSAMFNSIKGTGDSAIPAIKIIIIAGGVAMMLIGFFKWVQAGNQQQPKGPAITYVVIGVIMVSITTFVKTVGDTLTVSPDSGF